MVALPPTAVLDQRVVYLDKPPQAIARFTIDSFANIPRRRNMPVKSKEFLMACSDWRIEVFPGGTHTSPEGSVSVYLQSGLLNRYPDELNVKMSIVNHVNETLTVTRVQRVDTPPPFSAPPYAAVGWEDFVSWAGLRDPGKGFLTCGGLHQQCEVMFGGFGGHFCVTDRVSESRPPAIVGDTFAQDVARLWRAGTLTDVTFRAEGCEVVAHRTVLAARSEVFAKMFTTDMAESRTGVVDLSDMRVEVLKLLFEFMYTDKVDNPTDPQLLADLFEAAQKYEMTRLENWCADRIMDCLRVDNVVDWLLFALQVNSERLVSLCKDIIKGQLPGFAQQCPAQWRLLQQTPELFTEVVSQCGMVSQAVEGERRKRRKRSS